MARIGRPHSLRGEVTVRLHTDAPHSRLVAGATFATEPVAGDGVRRTLTLRSVRVHNGTWLLGFEGIADRTGAESLRGIRLLLDAGAQSAQPQVTSEQSADAWYPEELVGLAVLSTQGQRLGEVTGLETSPAQDLLVLRLSGGGRAYVPFVSALVPEVDVAGGKVVIDPPEGLLELNAT